jgi:hypothetical protein
MTLKWVAELLVMGSWSNVSNLQAEARKKAKWRVKMQNAKTDPFTTPLRA